METIQEEDDDFENIVACVIFAVIVGGLVILTSEHTKAIWLPILNLFP